ncbi:hypothetical protein T12_14642, partial [Trichinella patagoniensis]
LQELSERLHIETVFIVQSSVSQKGFRERCPNVLQNIATVANCVKKGSARIKLLRNAGVEQWKMSRKV